MTPTNNPAVDFRLKPEDHALLEQLDNIEQTLILDRHKDRLKYAEIAALRGMALGTVKSRLHRSLCKLLQLRSKAVQNPE